MIEKDETIQKQIIWLMATIYKYSIRSNGSWLNLLEVINNMVLSTEEEKHVFGMMMLSLLIEESAEEMKPHYVMLCETFIKILKEGNLKSVLYVIKCINNMIPYMSECEFNVLNSLFQFVIDNSVKLLQANQSEEAITSVFELFESFVEYEIPFIANYAKSLTFIVLTIVSDSSLLSSTRITFMNFLNVLIETQKSSLLKYEMIKPIIESALLIMSNSNEQLQIKSKLEMDLLEGEKLEDFETDDSDNIFSSACQVLDYCALQFPAKKLVPIIIDYANSNLSSKNSLHRRASLAALAITCEGCADYYKRHHIDVLTDACLKGMQDFEPSVVQISYFALSQFSEFLQPNITRYSDRFMRLFIESIETKLELRSINRLTLRFYGALQSFCENLGDDLEQYLATLMSKLMTLEVLCSASLKIKRLILSTFSSIISSIKSKFDPYFDYVIQLIKPHIQLDFQSLEFESTTSKYVEIECIELMAVLAKNISKTKFTPILVENSLLLIQNALNGEHDPELRSAAYHLLAGLSCKLKEKLPVNHIVPQILSTLRSEEGINIVDSSEKAEDVLDEIDLVENDVDEEIIDEQNSRIKEQDRDEKDSSFYDLKDDSKNVVVENEFIAEKMAALYCVQEISKHKNLEFLEFYDECFSEITRLRSFVNINVRKESFLALAHLIAYNYEIFIKGAPNLDSTTLTKFNENFQEFFNKSIKAIQLDLNRELVMSVFNSIKVLLTRISPYIRDNLAIFSNQMDTIGNIVIDTFQSKIYCQTINKIDQNEEDDAEYDFILKEYAGEILPSMALCLDHNSFFSNIIDFLSKILTKPNSTSTEISFSIALIGEIVNNLDRINNLPAQKLFSQFYSYLYSTEEDLKSNAMFSIGIICLKSDNSLSSLYPKVVSDLYAILENEKNKQTIDNICGTLARLFICSTSANLQTIDYQLLINKIFVLTPLKVDITEYDVIFKLIFKMMTTSILLPHYTKIIDLCVKVLAIEEDELIKENTKELAKCFLKHVQTNFSHDLTILLSQLDKNSSDLIKDALIN